MEIQKGVEPMRRKDKNVLMYVIDKTTNEIEQMNIRNTVEEEIGKINRPGTEIRILITGDKKTILLAIFNGDQRKARQLYEKIKRSNKIVTSTFLSNEATSYEPKKENKDSSIKLAA